MMFSSTCKKAIVVATVALTLPVLGSSAALAAGPADGGGKAKGNSGASSQASGHGKGSETDTSGSSANPDGTFQGKSTSRPDQDGKGMDRGAANNDKTGRGTDGNNGCGNEPRSASPRNGGRPTDDDNNGWCGSKPKSSKPSTGVKSSNGNDAQPKDVSTGKPKADQPKANPPKGSPAKGNGPDARPNGPKVDNGNGNKGPKGPQGPKAKDPQGPKDKGPKGPKGPDSPRLERPSTTPTVPGAPALTLPADPNPGDVGVGGVVIDRAPAVSAPRTQGSVVRPGVVTASPRVDGAQDQVLSAQSSAAPRALPFTGASVGLLVLLAGVIASTGAALVLLGRRRTTS